MGSAEGSALAPSGATVIEAAAPWWSSRRRIALLVAGFLALDAVIGIVVFTTLAWWVGVLFVVVSVGQLPFLGKAVARKAQNLPSRLEVSADRITSVVVPRGDAQEISRADGDLLTVRDLNGEPHLYVVGPAGDNGSIGLGRFDVEAVGRAALAHGWPWQPKGSDAVIPPATRDSDVASSPPHPRVEITVREGMTRTVPGKTTTGAVAALVLGLCGALVFAAVVGEERWGLPSWAGTVLVVMAVLLPVALLVASGFVLVRLSTATVTVDSRRLAVKYGSLSASVVERSTIATGQAGKRWVRMRNHAGKQLLWVPLRPKRDEVLAALRSYGWPTSGR